MGFLNQKIIRFKIGSFTETLIYPLYIKTVVKKKSQT